MKEKQKNSRRSEVIVVTNYYCKQIKAIFIKSFENITELLICERIGCSLRIVTENPVETASEFDEIAQQIAITLIKRWEYAKNIRIW